MRMERSRINVAILAVVAVLALDAWRPSAQDSQQSQGAESILDSSPGDWCRSPAVFVFGASYMDVGENSAAMPFRSDADFAPYGIDFFGTPTGRHSNGRLIIDHIAQGLGQEFWSPYLRNVGANFQHGVNFASSGSTACNSSVQGDGSLSAGLFSLSVQIDQFQVFLQQTLSMSKARKDGLLLTPEAFARGVYIIESGNNDYINVRSDQYEAMTPLVLKQIEHAVQTLYNLGARIIVVMDAFPAACFPCMLQNAAPHQLNEDGCVTPFVKAIEPHNVGLRVMVANLNAVLVGATVITFSLHDVFMSAIKNPSKFGLKYVHKACCGYGGGEYNSNKAVHCGRDGIVDGELRKATVCENRSEYMMWDNVHPTEAFAFHIAQAFLQGEHMQPPFRVKDMCRHEQYSLNSSILPVFSLL